MREILFRGRREDGGGWAYGSLIVVEHFCCILESEDDGSRYDFPYLNSEMGTIDGNAIPVIPETVGQFTGLTDKNGKKIFEGDIVRAMMDYGPAGFYERTVSIGWLDDVGYQWQYFDIPTIEVIGNIHDNPELLKEGADNG